MRNLDRVRWPRAAALAMVLSGLVGSLTGCGGDDTPPSQSPTSGPPAASTTPTEKTPRINPGEPKPFSPTVLAPPAPTAIPGNRENTG
jgi:hypothetical protein